MSLTSTVEDVDGIKDEVSFLVVVLIFLVNVLFGDEGGVLSKITEEVGDVKDSFFVNVVLSVVSSLLLGISNVSGG